MQTKRRARIPKAVETQVLVRSRRRCCLCYFVERVTGRRLGQIAHLDHDRSNNRPGNLVWLCQEHHDDYDSRRSQTKNFTRQEVREYRTRLHSVVEKQDSTVTLPSGPQEPQSAAPSSTSLLGAILEASDRAMGSIEHHDPPNGIALEHLAGVAVREAGDFGAAQEALTALFALGAAHEARGDQLPSLSYFLPSAHPVLGAVRVLKTFAEIDHGLFVAAIHRAWRSGILGETRFTSFDPGTAQVPPGCYSTSLSLTALARAQSSRLRAWVGSSIARALAGMVIGAGMLLHWKGISLPAPPERLLCDVGGRRRAEEGAQETEPFVWLAYCIASLPADAYSAALDALVYRRGISFVTVDAKHSIPLQDALNAVNRWSVFPGFALVSLSVRSQPEADRCKALLAEAETAGAAVAKAAKAFVEKERALWAGAGRVWLRSGE